MQTPGPAHTLTYILKSKYEEKFIFDIGPVRGKSFCQFSIIQHLSLYTYKFYTMRCDQISLLETGENFEILKSFIDVF